ncbi:MAG: TolC family outer membrane protein [Pseudomonadota bacterium]
MRLRHITSTALVLSLLAAPLAHAETLDLLATLRLADQNDPNLAAVRASARAAAQGPTIARASLLPNLVASGSIGDTTLAQNSSNGMGGSIPTTTDYLSKQWSVKLTQPLFDWTSWHQFSAAKLQFSQAQSDAQDKTQSLFLAVSEAYFDVLRADDNLTLAIAQEAAFNRQRDQAEARFNVGLIARADVMEAEAQRDGATAQRLSAEIGLSNAREKLNAAVGRDIGTLARLRENLPLDAPVPDDAEAWAKLARERNPGLIAARLQSEAALSARQAQRGGYLPQVGLFVSRSVRENSKVSGTNQSIMFNAGDTDVVGVEAQWELFASGRTRALVQQATDNAEASKQSALAREHQVVTAARTSYLTLKVDSARLQARQRAQASAQLAYQATKAGYDVGTRNIVDLLLAETNLYLAKRDYANARYDYVINSLRLQAAAGMLSEENVAKVNSWLTL